MYNREIDYSWDFRTSNTKEYSHCYHTYPAMMIPQIVRKLIKEYSPKGKLDLIFDPYMGSGTTLVESCLEGIKSFGTDLNPLARLISKVKCNSYNINEINEDVKYLKDKIECFKSCGISKDDFSHITKVEYWYRDDILEKLKYITDILDQIKYNENHDFFILALTESVREASYTRNGEFKRFRIALDKLDSFNVNPFDLFIKKIERNIKGLREFNNDVKSSAKVYDFNTVYGFPDDVIDESIDLVITSPPYGDSKTTVAYGQFSRWANEWLKFDNAITLDNILMGGKKRKDIDVCTKSIREELEQIRAIDEKRYLEVLYFLDDYKKSIVNISKKVRKGGRVCYVVGNRNVKGVQISLDYYTAEMFENNGFKHDTTIVRNIPNKRMPSKTSPTNKSGVKVGTMSNEFIVVMTKK